MPISTDWDSGPFQDPSANATYARSTAGQNSANWPTSFDTTNNSSALGPMSVAANKQDQQLPQPSTFLQNPNRLGFASLQSAPENIASQPSPLGELGLGLANNPLPTTGINSSIQSKRVNTIGATPVIQLFQALKKDNPDALTPKDYTNQQLELDPTGKPIAGNVLNKDLFNDPRFQRLLKLQPDLAHKFYAAVHGRDLGQDITMQAAHEASVNKSDREVLDQFKKSGDFDPITGQPFIRQMVPDKFDPTIQTEVKRPLSFFEKQVLTKQGAFENVTGQKQPEGMAIPSSVGNVTPAGAKLLREKVAEFQKANPNEPLNVSVKKAQQAIAGVQSSASTGTGTGAAGGLVRAGDVAGQTAMGLINAGPIDTANLLMSGANSLAYGIPRMMGAKLPYAPQIPHIPVPTSEQLQAAHEGSTVPSMGDIASETVDYWNRKVPSLNRF